MNQKFPQRSVTKRPDKRYRKSRSQRSQSEEIGEGNKITFVYSNEILISNTVTFRTSLNSHFT